MAREAVRTNDIKIIKGTPASKPVKPVMVKTNDRWQYPLAYIYVGAGVTSIRQANITNCVGTSECPFVTAPLDKVEIDDLIVQWQDQWKDFYEKQTTDMEETNKFWKEQWSTWFLAQTEEIQSAYLTWEAQWNLWYSEHTADMEATSTYWKEKWEAWFNEYTSINTAEMADWKQKSETEFRDWFEQLQALLDGNTAASFAKKLLELQEQVDILNQFSSNLENEYTVYQKLYDNGYRTYGDVLDSSDASITDSNLDTVIGRTYSSDLLRDSNGDVIEAFKSAIASSDILCAMRFYFQKLGNISFMITAHLSRGAEFHNRENDLKSISTNTTNYTEMTVIFYSVTFRSSMTILSMRSPNENC